jgi:excisionase family DNA binding protein
MVDERSFTVPEVASRLRVSKWTVLNWLRSGNLRGYRPGGTKIGWRIRESALLDFISSRENEADTAARDGEAE